MRRCPYKRILAIFGKTPCFLGCFAKVARNANYGHLRVVGVNFGHLRRSYGNEVTSAGPSRSIADSPAGEQPRGSVSWSPACVVTLLTLHPPAGSGTLSHKDERSSTDATVF